MTAALYCIIYIFLNRLFESAMSSSERWRGCACVNIVSIVSTGGACRCGCAAGSRCSWPGCWYRYGFAGAIVGLLSGVEYSASPAFMRTAPGGRVPLNVSLPSLSAAFGEHSASCHHGSTSIPSFHRPSRSNRPDHGSDGGSEECATCLRTTLRVTGSRIAPGAQRPADSCGSARYLLPRAALHAASRETAPRAHGQLARASSFVLQYTLMHRIFGTCSQTYGST